MALRAEEGIRGVPTQISRISWARPYDSYAAKRHSMNAAGILMERGQMKCQCAAVQY